MQVRGLSDTLLFFSSIHQYLLISILTFIANKDQSFQSNRSLISGVLLTTGTIQYHKRSKTQKAKVKESKSESGHIHPKVKVATFTKKHMKDLLLKKFNWILQFSSPLAPPPLLLPCPKCLLTET